MSGLIVGDSLKKKYFFVAGIVLVALLRLFHLQKGTFSHDDYLWFHTTWNVANGYILYKDVFSFYTPLTFYINSFAFFSSDIASITNNMRYIAFLFYIGNIISFFYFSKYFFKEIGKSLISTFLFAIGTEALWFIQVLAPRETLVLFFWINTMNFFIYGFQKNNKVLLLSGICAALTILAHQRAAPMIAAILFYLIVYHIKKDNIIEQLKKNAISSVPFFIGFAIPILFTIGYFAIHGALASMINQTVFFASKTNYLSFTEALYFHEKAVLMNIFLAPFVWVIGLIGSIFYIVKKDK